MFRLVKIFTTSVFACIFVLTIGLASACAADDTDKNKADKSKTRTCRPLTSMLELHSNDFTKGFNKDNSVNTNETSKTRLESFQNGGVATINNIQELRKLATAIADSICRNSKNANMDIKNTIIELEQFAIKTKGQIKTNNRYENNNNKLLAGQAHILRLETIGQLAIKNKDMVALESLVADMKKLAGKLPEPLQIPANDTADLQYVGSIDEILQFSIFSMLAYYEGIIAVNNGKNEEAWQSLTNLQRLAVDFSFVEYPDFAIVSHTNEKQARAAIVMNVIRLMELAMLVLDKDIEFRLNADKQLQEKVLGIRAQALYKHTSQKTDNPFLRQEFIEQLKMQLNKSDEIKRPAIDVTKIAFMMGEDKFRHNWPYDYGKFVWDYVLEIRSQYWQKYRSIKRTQAK